MSTTSVPTPTSRCLAGLARTEITPPVGIYHRMWGAAKHDRAAGVHRPLFATVLILEPLTASDAERHYLVALDHCLLRPEDMDRFHEDVAGLLAIESDQLTVIFSHTHSGGLIVRSRADLPGGELIGPYLDELPHRVAEAAKEALNSRRQVVMTYATTFSDMARNRDYRDVENGLHVCGFNPDAENADGPGYPLHVVRMTNAETNEPVGVIVNYPCHPTTLAWDNALISPDYIGALRETVENAVGAPCLFVLAPCGDVGPRHGFVGDVEVADRNGRQVAYAALSALESMPAPCHEQHYAGPVISGATIGAWEFRPLSIERHLASRAFLRRSWSIPLDYHQNLPSLQDAEKELRVRESAEQSARDRGAEVEAGRLRAMVERQRRLIERIRPLPPGRYPYRVKLLKIGDAIWIELEGEPYFYLQGELQRRFPQTLFIFAVLSNGSRPSYLPRREDYDKPLYQVEVSLLAAGSLERIVDEISSQLERLPATSA
ncbi:MAG: hypothetical protein AB7O26_02805 [Planctomycetaceae bacterium]